MAEENCKCVCGKTCPACGCDKQLSIFNVTFWDQWLMKLFRNMASMKFQWLLLLYIPVIWGMFHMNKALEPPMPWVSATLGLSFLGGGFVTLATTRIIARTKLTNGTNGELDTDK